MLIINRIKVHLFFVLLFLITFGYGSYNQHLKLFENPFSTIPNEQWVQESPIQFFIGYVINLVLGNSLTSYWVTVISGFLFLYFSLLKFENIHSDKISIIKILYFSPFFLILFYWMGKPDTYLIGSLFLLLTYYSNKLIILLSILIMVFSHPQIAIVYLLLSKYLGLIKLKIEHYFATIITFVLYFFYYKSLNDFETRFEYISNDLVRLFETFFTNTLAGFMSYFMWLWIPILASGIIKKKKFIISSILVLLISFFTLDNTRIFLVLSIPLIIYTSQDPNFQQNFNKIFNNSFTYLLGLLQIQKRADGKIVDGNNISENLYFDEYTKLISDFISNYLK